MAWLDHALFQGDMLGIKHPVHPKRLLRFLPLFRRIWTLILPALWTSMAQEVAWDWKVTSVSNHTSLKSLQCPETEHVDAWERNLPLDFSVWDIHVARKFQVTKFQERRQSSKAHYLNLFLFSISMWQSSICISVTDFRESYSEVWIKYKISLFPLDSTTQLCVISVKDTSP